MIPQANPRQLLDVADQAFRAGAIERARALATAACEADPTLADPWLLRADIARRAGDMVELELALGQAALLATEPRMRLRLEIDRGWALRRLGRDGDCFALARRLGELAPDPVESRFLGALLHAAGLTEAAEPHLALAAATDASAESWYDVALVEHALGRVTQAAAACERAIAAKPSLAQAHALLASLGSWTPDDNHAPRLRSALAGAADPLDRARLGYALFKELDDLGRTDEAWAALQAAGAQARTIFPWSAERDLSMVRGQAALVPGPKAGAPVASDGPRPIFVVGLPRSGTTLVERVLDRHSGVKALGELTTLGVLADPRPDRKPWPYAALAAIERLHGVDWPDVGRRYRQQADLMADGAAAIVDKNPQNWAFAGAIAAALPDAVLVHVSRGPMDSLFGAHRQLFLREHAWSAGLDDLAAHYRHYRALTAHWAERLGAQWVDVSYEALASDPAAEVPRLLTACGLAFEAECLAPEQGGGGVQTLSAMQVREPINPRRIGNWRRYAAQLEPLRARLEALGLADADGEATGYAEVQLLR